VHALQRVRENLTTWNCHGNMITHLRSFRMERLTPSEQRAVRRKALPDAQQPSLASFCRRATLSSPRGYRASQLVQRLVA